MTRTGTLTKTLSLMKTLHFEIPEGPRRKPCKDQRQKSVASNSIEKLLEDEGYLFKKISEDVYELDGYVEEDWYELRGTNSLQYYYSEEDIQYILRRHANNWEAAMKKEVIDLTRDSN